VSALVTPIRLLILTLDYRIHQDINIVISHSGGQLPYDVVFKLADFGYMRFKEKPEIGQDVHGNDRGGTLREKVLGKEHPHTLTSMSNVAQALSRQGKYAEAEKMHRETMTLREKVLRKEHPHTLTSMANLVSTYWNQERWKEVGQLELQVAETRKKELGERHPDTLASMENLAFTWKPQGRKRDALLLMKECSWLQLQALGTEHPNTLSSLQTLDEWQIEE